MVWTDLDDATAANGIVGVRVSPDGTVLDSSPIAMLTGTTAAVAASAAGDFFVAGVVPITYNTNQLKGVRVSTDGVRLDGVPRVLGSNYAESPDVSAFGGGWVVTWAHRHSYDSGLRDAAYVVVASDGTPTAEALVHTAGSAAKETGVNVATDGTSALIVWSDDGDIRGRLLDSAGALAGDGAGFVVAAQANSQFDPDVAWDGSTYVVAWTDWRAHPSLEPGEGDVYTTMVDATGAVDDTSGTLVGGHDVPEGNVALAAAEARAVLVWTRLVDDAPFGAFRLRTAYAPDDGTVDTGDTGEPDSGDTADTDDTDPPDTGDTDDTDDTDVSDTDPVGTDTGDTSEKEGCGCASSGPSPFVWAAFLPIVLARRRR